MAALLAITAYGKRLRAGRMTTRCRCVGRVGFSLHPGVAVAGWTRYPMGTQAEAYATGYETHPCIPAFLRMRCSPIICCGMLRDNK